MCKVAITSCTFEKVPHTRTLHIFQKSLCTHIQMCLCALTTASGNAFIHPRFHHPVPNVIKYQYIHNKDERYLTIICAF